MTSDGIAQCIETVSQIGIFNLYWGIFKINSVLLFWIKNLFKCFLLIFEMDLRLICFWRKLEEIENWKWQDVLFFFFLWVIH